MYQSRSETCTRGVCSRGSHLHCAAVAKFLIKVDPDISLTRRIKGRDGGARRRTKEEESDKLYEFQLEPATRFKTRFSHSGNNSETLPTRMQNWKMCTAKLKMPKQLIIISVYSPALITTLLYDIITYSPLSLRRSFLLIYTPLLACSVTAPRRVTLEIRSWRRENGGGNADTILYATFLGCCFSPPPPSLYHTGTLTVTLLQLTTTHFCTSMSRIKRRT